MPSRRTVLTRPTVTRSFEAPKCYARYHNPSTKPYNRLWGSSAPEPMINYRFHLILESAFQFNWRWWRLYPAVFPVRLKKRDMKHGMDSLAKIHLKLIRYGSHNLHDFKWTNPFGEKLARRFAMLQVKVLCTQQYLFTNLVDLVYTTPICKRFLSLLSGNQTFACKTERILQTLNECSRRWVHRLYDIIHWSLRVVAVSQLKRG
jgi:hypothetical protein